MCRDFIWGIIANARKCHLIGWNTICSPKEEGGLGFRNLKGLNKAYMLKFGWQLIAHPAKLWVRIMKAKYGSGPQAVPIVRQHNNCSRTWRGIATGWPLIQANLFWVVRNGRDTRFWRDHWIPGIDNLVTMLDAQVPNGEQEISVRHYVTNDQWDWGRLRPWLSDAICQKIAVIKPPAGGLPDFPCWSLSNDGQFSLKFAYGVAAEEPVNMVNQDPIFTKIWHWASPKRYQAFLWKVAHERLLTNVHNRHYNYTNKNKRVNLHFSP